MKAPNTVCSNCLEGLGGYMASEEFLFEGKSKPPTSGSMKLALRCMAGSPICSLAPAMPPLLAARTVSDEHPSSTLRGDFGEVAVSDPSVSLTCMICQANHTMFKCRECFAKFGEKQNEYA